jgi:hypothetical protein
LCSINYLFCQLSLSSLEKALHAYTLGPATQPFDIKAVPVAAVEEETRAKVSLKGLSHEIDLIFEDMCG